MYSATLTALIYLLVIAFPYSGQKAEQSGLVTAVQSDVSSVCDQSIACGKGYVRLSVNFVNPHPDEKMLVTWEAEVGKIEGEGRSVTWDLWNAPVGDHRATVVVRDEKHKLETRNQILISVEKCGICDPPMPSCPEMEVVCTVELKSPDRYLFSAKAKEAPNVRHLKPRYLFEWKLNAGRIERGQGTREIEVSTKDTTGFDTITATLLVWGSEPSCPSTAVSCSTGIKR